MKEYFTAPTFEDIERVRCEGYARGRADGYIQGKADGYEAGIAEYSDTVRRREDSKPEKSIREQLEAIKHTVDAIWESVK